MPTMRVVHVCQTPVAGAPVKVARALRVYGNIHARLVDLAPMAYGARTFPEDLCWPDDKEKILTELYTADIIHLHQRVPLKIRELNVDLTDKNRFGTMRLIREWHSEPGHFARQNRVDLDAFKDESFPLLAMAQYHERYYPHAIPVPLFTNVEEFGSKIIALPFSPPVVAYSPSTRLPLHEWRWASKGYAEILAVLEKLKEEFDFLVDIIEDVPWDEAIERKRNATFIIDDLVTGSFHTSGLEGLALGKPTFSYLDPRTIATLTNLTGSNALPFINCSLRDFPAVFKKLINNYTLSQSIGDYSRAWMEKYYHEKNLIQHYVAIYNKLLAGELPPRRELQRTEGEEFFATGLYDTLFTAMHGFSS